MWEICELRNLFFIGRGNHIFDIKGKKCSVPRGSYWQKTGFFSQNKSRFFLNGDFGTKRTVHCILIMIT